MDVTFYDLNIFSIILLASLLIVIYSKHELHTLRGRLFRILILTAILMLVLEIHSWIYDGLPGITNYRANVFFNTVFTMLSTLIVGIWALYIDYVLFNNEQRLKKNAWFYFAPVVITSILGIINLFTPILFVVSDDNIYSRLPGIWTGVVLSYVVYIFVLVMVLNEQKRLTSNFIIGVMMFLILPLVAGVIQIQYLGLTLIWPSTAMAILFSYLLFETTSSSLDYLTGIHTRVRAEDYMKGLMRRRHPFTIIMMDMDDFKQLNDTYGHTSGDKALIEMATILKQVFERKDIVARYGGDEFIVVTAGVNKGRIELIRKNISNHMKSSKNNYIKEAKFSMGVSYCQQPTSCTIETLMIEADNNMYLDKAKHKNLKRRQNDR
ncbi:GGDEF domain-containing protein [Candidatus Xianfuyuplasma coldseepsis]|uniref:GGDEF domain-containing protein n=1 Tax=Candidatus Xianfuyuplasma coldseepsis TaxID=2782163 RepID=A0A7L7KPS9_9MOLU|nr:GGDEF domain-containing protein [Xianfuyuplasma coldseepsis]QMS84575.1 GGDEF domain-containing protein [Xianfuyuplasma coldseepsis]